MCNCEPWNCVEQAVNDVWSTKQGQITGLVDRAETAADNSEISAKASADSAVEAKEFRDEAELAATTAVAAQTAVVGVATSLQNTADSLEQSAEELSNAIAGITVVTWYYTAVSENQTVIPVPDDKNQIAIQAIYVEGARKEPGPDRDFTYDPVTKQITLVEGIPLGQEITIILGIYPENSDDITHILASSTGAGLIGTTNGNTVQGDLNINLLNDREQWRRSLVEAGLTLVDGSFEEGATVSTQTDAVWYAATGQCYTWAGTFPHTAESAPMAGWAPVTDMTLRSALAEASGSNLSGFSQAETYTEGTVGYTIKNIRVAVSSLGLSDTDAEFNANQLNTKLPELFALGVTEIYMDRDYAVDPGYSFTTHTYARRVLHLTDFRFYGPGKFTGLYNTQTEYKLCPPPVAVNNSNIIINKLKKSTIKVVMFGDSISLDWADSLTLGISQWSIIKAELSAQNPEVTFEFVNRAYGGQTWANANTKPSSFPVWYTDTTRNWVDYIVDENPDIVIMAFGMNDRDSFNMGTMASTITKLKAGLPNAHYVMIPPLVPSRSSSYGNGVGFDGLRFQEGRNFAAGAMRTYALFNGMSVWDLNRYFVQCRDGLDQVACELQEVPGATPTNGAYTADACVDFAFEAKISGWDKTSPIYISCGGDESEDWIYIGNTGSGKFQISGRTEYIGTYHSLTSAITIPDADFWLVVTVLNNECHIYIDTNTETAVGDKPASTVLITSFRMIRHGGTVRPKIGTGGVITGNVAQIRVMLGKPGQRQKTITDREMWGTSDSTAARKLPHGGNGINHPSAQGIARIVTPVLQAQDLKIQFADLSFIVNLSAGLSQFLTPPVARVVGGVLQLKGGITGSAATEGATLATIYGWDSLGMGDFLVSTSGNAGSGWGTRLLRIKSDGNIVAEVGSNTSGVILNGISVPLI
ncbi:tail fiber protein [Pectobacterium phage Possum]|uniref:Tail spike protein n=1 Tax=Pectobacterium phage Possum TaxID=2686301 RepID=A0A7T0LWL4_9CAUD|nr:tail fiber protein [Pectobacterium phage Possum]QPL10907.1 tail spike protein [Pectobacterium phage Possum]QPL11009.1 tail spike protein [Pectobacterium phage Horatius]